MIHLTSSWPPVSETLGFCTELRFMHDDLPLAMLQQKTLHASLHCPKPSFKPS